MPCTFPTKATGWLSYIAPAGLPKETADLLSQSLLKALHRPAVSSAAAQSSYRIVASSSQEQVATLQR